MKIDPTKSRRYNFILEHRGGPLTKEQQRLLINWAILCVEHLLPRFADQEIDGRIFQALQTARDWEQGKVATGVAMKAALAAHAAARAAHTPALTALARAAGHTVATAHAADHSMGGALYGLKAINALGKTQNLASDSLENLIETEKNWQISLLPQSLKDLVVNALAEKIRYFKI